MRRKKENPNDPYEEGFYHPGTGRKIKVNKRIRRIWKVCKFIRRLSWIVVPISFIFAPWFLFPWIIICFLTVLGDGDACFVKAQENGDIWPPEFGGI